jgi:hypothetical protein
MLEWMVKNHEVVRDLATPVVTVIVGLVALFVQIHFNRKQTVVAEDKLKFDLFKKRHGLYLAASDMIDFVNSSKETPGEQNKFRELYGELEQAQFFFDDTACDFIGEILTASRRLIDLLNAEGNTDVWTKIRETRIELSRLYAELPLRLGPSLRFKQLTR